MRNQICAIFFNDIDVTWFCVIGLIYGFFALCRIDNAIDAMESTKIQSGARIVKMTIVLLLLNFTAVGQTMKYLGDNKFIVTNFKETFDTTKLIFIRTWMETSDSTMTEPCERFMNNRNSLKMNFDYYGIYVIKFKQKREDMDYDNVYFHVTYFANMVKISKTVSISYAVPRDLRD